MSKKIKLSNITPDDKNNNKHTAYGMDLLEKSVNKVGIIESITVSNDDKIISGNARHEIIGKNFTKEAIVIETDGTQPIIIKRTDIESDTKQFYEASILANTTSKKNIDFDMEVIDALVEEYDIDVVDLGVDIVNEEILEAEEDDFNGVAPKEPITVLGDLYEIGEHRLLCGDSTCSDTVGKLIGNNNVDFIWTDPPYGINEKGDRSKRGGLAKGNNLPDFKDNTIQYAIDAFNQPFNLDVKNQVWFGANYYCHTLPQSANWLVWDKRVEENQRDNNSDCELAWVLSNFNSVRIFRHLWKGMLKGSEHGEKRVHATQKPIALVEFCINEYNKECKTILDYFGGSGVSMVAAHQLKKQNLTMELEPCNCDVIVARMIKLDSTLPIKRNGVLLTNSEVLKFTENTSESN
jgi:DNA modification methylase